MISGAVGAAHLQYTGVAVKGVLLQKKRICCGPLSRYALQLEKRSCSNVSHVDGGVKTDCLTYAVRDILYAG